MYCICCKRDNVTPYDEMTNNSYSEEELLWGTEKTKDGRIRTINNRSANDGIIHMIDAGYGSTHDGVLNKMFKMELFCTGVITWDLLISQKMMFKSQR